MLIGKIRIVITDVDIVLLLREISECLLFTALCENALKRRPCQKPVKYQRAMLIQLLLTL